MPIKAKKVNLDEALANKACSESNLYPSNNSKSISANKLIYLFNSVFQKTENTILCGGGAEPEYLPASNRAAYHRVIFTHDYVSSALHEIAHWCIAGKERRLKPDYGYWYIPDGRNQQEQSQFEQVEVKPQALEWIFSRACGVDFRISVDNISAEGQSQPSHTFKQQIMHQAREYCRTGLDTRALRWLHALHDEFQYPLPLIDSYYSVDGLK